MCEGCEHIWGYALMATRGASPLRALSRSLDTLSPKDLVGIHSLTHSLTIHLSHTHFLSPGTPAVS